MAKLRRRAGPAPVVHFIGRLQTNKVQLLARVVDVWQSVDRPPLVAALARHARAGRAGARAGEHLREPAEGRLRARSRRAGLVRGGRERRARTCAG